MSVTALIIPRGNPQKGPSMTLEMSDVYNAERRLGEVAVASPVTAPMLMGYFNEVCNTTTKYLSWVEYEILNAQKQLELAKATVILDKAPEEFKKLKDAGVKSNEDFRNALIARDEECSRALDTLNSLLAVRSLLESKARTFVRAYNACRSIWERRQMTAASPNFNAAPGQTYDQPQANFMGVTGQRQEDTETP